MLEVFQGLKHSAWMPSISCAQMRGYELGSYESKKKTHVFLGATVPVLEPHVFHVGVFGEEGCLNQKKNVMPDVRERTMHCHGDAEP